MRSPFGIRSFRTPLPALIMAAVFVFCIGTAAVMPAHNSLSRLLNCSAFDFLLSICDRPAPHTAPSDIVVLDIDDDAVSRSGQWPWPRYQLGLLLSRIFQESPAMLGVDILFSDEDRSSLESITKNYRDYFGYSLDLGHVPQALMNNDEFLAAVLKQGRAAGCAVSLDSTLAGGISSRTVELRNGESIKGLLPDLPAAERVLENIPSVQNAFLRTGLVNTEPDADGVLRRLPMFFRHGGKLYPSVSAAFLLEAMDCPSAELSETVFGPVLRFAGPDGKTCSVPVYRDGTAAPRWRTEKRYSVIPVNELIDRNLFPQLRGKTVLIGCSATGIHDWQTTPLRQTLSSAEILASFLSDARDACAGSPSFLTIPAWSGMFELISVWLSCLACMLFFLLLPLRRAIAAAVLFTVSAAGTGAAVFAFLGVFLPLWTALLVHCALTAVFLFILHIYAQKDREISDSYKKLADIKQLLIESTSMIAEVRTMEKNGHIKRTQAYVRILAEELRKTDRYAELTDSYITNLCSSAPLHDIGKMTIPDSILFKPGKLSDSEFEIMKTHSRKGADILHSVSKESEDHFLDLAASIALTHHEKWDGSGYPDGLKGTAIPLCGRIMALADVYDALSSKRVYKAAYPHEKARSIIVSGSGSHFDPDIVTAFLNAERKFIETSIRISDSENG